MDSETTGSPQPGHVAGDGPGTPHVARQPARWLGVLNLVLTLSLLVCLVLQVMPLPVLFAVAFAVALLVNHPRWEDQRALLEKHAKSVVLVTTMIFAAGVFTGVLTETAEGFGTGQAEVARAAILGQMTTGFPLSPLTASTFILIGMSGVQLGEHQRFIFRWAFATTLVMTAAALLTGAISL